LGEEPTELFEVINPATERGAYAGHDWLHL